MKKRILLFTAIAGMSALFLTSGKNGSGFQKGYNATGAETGLGNLNGCNASGCHGATATAGITLSVELDSMGVPQTHYYPGAIYQIKVKGTNTTSTTYSHFGFQVVAIRGSVAMPAPVNAGTFQSTGLPTNVRFVAPTVNYVCSLVEHSNPMPATTLGGATGGTYEVVFNWTAPVAGTGTVSLWSAINVCNNDNTAGGDAWKTSKVVLTETNLTLGASAKQAEMSVTASPNPATTNLNLRIENAAAGAGFITVLDVAGKSVYREDININGTFTKSINTSAWLPGNYQVVLGTGGNHKSIQVVKQ